MSNVIKFHNAERQILTPAHTRLTAMRLVRNRLLELHLEMESVLDKLVAANEAAERLGVQEGHRIAQSALAMTKPALCRPDMEMHPTTNSLIGKLIDDLLAVGCEICAVGQGYCINEPQDEPAASTVAALLADFGPRMHLLADFNAELRARGLYIEI